MSFIVLCPTPPPFCGRVGGGGAAVCESFFFTLHASLTAGTLNDVDASRHMQCTHTSGSSRATRRPTSRCNILSCDIQLVVISYAMCGWIHSSPSRDINKSHSNDVAIEGLLLQDECICISVSTRGNESMNNN
jgi:hypothetical protein